MHAAALVELTDGRTHELVPGDIVGRMSWAALHYDDARISEAHALVSLRGCELKLLALRGGFGVAGKPRREVVLEPDLEVELAPGLGLRVLEVSLPGAVLGIGGDRVPLRMLPPICSISADNPPKLQARWVTGAPVRIWSTGSEWRMQCAGKPTQTLRPGDSVPTPGGELRVVKVPLESAGAVPTRAPGRFQPLRLVANYDTVQLHRQNRPAVVIGGLPARIVSELVALDGPVAWRVLADLVWPRETERSLLRTRLDVHLSRLRRKLREAGIRPDLVRSTGSGHIELLLYDQDEVIDRS